MKTLINRRQLLSTAAAGGTGLLLAPSFLASAHAQSAPATPARLSAETVNDSISVISGAGGNVLVKKADSGALLVVDGGLAQHASALLEQIQSQMASDDITLLVNTHWHPEQTGLNRLLGERGVKIFAHENTRLWLGTEIARPWEDQVFAPLPEQARPNETFYHYGELAHGNSKMLFGHLRQAHTDGDTYAWFPQDNVLHTGGLIASDAWPLLDWWTGGWMGGLVDGLDTLLQLSNDDTVIVPASGPLMTRGELADMHAMYATLNERINTMFRAANSPEDTLQAKPAGEFEGRLGDSDMFVLLAHQSLIPHITPDA